MLLSDPCFQWSPVTSEREWILFIQNSYQICLFSDQNNIPGINNSITLPCPTGNFSKLQLIHMALYLDFFALTVAGDDGL